MAGGALRVAQLPRRIKTDYLFGRQIIPGDGRMVGALGGKRYYSPPVRSYCQSFLSRFPGGDGRLCRCFRSKSCKS